LRDNDAQGIDQAYLQFLELPASRRLLMAAPKFLTLLEVKRINKDYGFNGAKVIALTGAGAWVRQ
jgi:hypothetical protein